MDWQRNSESDVLPDDQSGVKNPGIPSHHPTIFKIEFHFILSYISSFVEWFFGLKLHIVTNDKGELLAFKVTRGSRSDSKEAAPLLKSLQGLAFGDKGYPGKKVFDELFENRLEINHQKTQKHERKT